MTGADAVKLLLAGATAFQVVSTLYINGINHISNILSSIEEWMNRKGYSSLDEFRGKLAKKNLHDPFAYLRAQYVDILLRSNDIIRNSPI